MAVPQRLNAETAHHGIRRVLSADLAAMESLQRDRLGDVEVIHQLRVCGRRTRTLLALLGQVLPKREVADLDGELRWLGRLTGPVRDLDVLLAWLGRPRPDRARLGPVRGALRERRRRRAEELADALSSARFGRLLDTWRALLDARRPRRSAAKAPLRELLRGAARRAHRKLVRDIDRLGKRARSTELHEVRIRGKDLRYLLLGFPEHYPVGPSTRLLEALRVMQGELGKIQDFEVGADILRDLTTRNDPELAAVARNLRAELRRQRDRRRERAARRSRKFVGQASTDAAALVAALSGR